MLYKLKSGFTLVELLVVIAVLGILSAVLIITINPVVQIQRGRDTQRKSNLATIQSALELYRHDFGYYPISSGLYGSSLTNCTTDSFQGTTTSGGTVIYLQAIPCDPLGLSTQVFNGGEYLYDPYNPSDTSSPTYTCDNSTYPCLSYYLIACLENTSDTGENTYSTTNLSSDFPYISTLPVCPPNNTNPSIGRYYIVQNP